MMKSRRFDLAWMAPLFWLVMGCAAVSDDGPGWSAPERLDTESLVHGNFAVALDAPFENVLDAKQLADLSDAVPGVAKLLYGRT